MMRCGKLWMWLAPAAMTALSMVSGGCSVSPATGEMQFIVISTQQEIALGADAAPEMEKQFGGMVDDKRLRAYVRSVGGKVAAQAERKMPYEFSLLATDIPNAFALPGGRIYVTAGLMLIMTNERQLAAVLGHEIGHVTDRHNVQILQRKMGAAVLADLAGTAIEGKRGEAAKIGVQIVAGMENLRYSRSNEYQADLLGIRYMSAAGYNPWGMVELLRALQQASGADGSRWAEMMQTHPLTGKRIAEAAQLVRQARPNASPDAADPNRARFVRMQRRLTDAMRRKAAQEKDDKDEDG